MLRSTEGERQLYGRGNPGRHLTQVTVHKQHDTIRRTNGGTLTPITAGAKRSGGNVNDTGVAQCTAATLREIPGTGSSLHTPCDGMTRGSVIAVGAVIGRRPDNLPPRAWDRGPEPGMARVNMIINDGCREYEATTHYRGTPGQHAGYICGSNGPPGAWRDQISHTGDIPDTQEEEWCRG